MRVSCAPHPPRSPHPPHPPHSLARSQRLAIGAAVKTFAVSLSVGSAAPDRELQCITSAGAVP